MEMLDALAASPLAAIGKAAVAAPDSLDGNPLLSQFNSAIAPYSTDRSGVDWPLVKRVATALAGQSCDLKVYGYLALAAVYNASEDETPYLPLAAVLRALGDVIEQGWPRCLPRSDARRQAQLKWLSEELGALVKTKPPAVKHRLEFDTCAAEAERTAEQAGTALGLGYPILRELREALKTHQQSLPVPAMQVPPVAPSVPATVEKATNARPSLAAATSEPSSSPPAPEPARVPVAVSVTPSTGPPSVVGPPPVVDPSMLSREALEDQLAAIVLQLTAQLRADSLTDPAPYWMLRALRWGGHDFLRPERAAEIVSNKNKTPIPLPQDYRTIVKEIPRRLAAGQGAAVVGDCEELFAANPLWLDLQRWIASGLESLDAGAARSVIRSQLGLLLQNCPLLPQFRFADRDGTPMADAETVAWLKAEQAAVSTSSPSPGPSSATEQLPEGLLAGVQFLQKQITQAVSGSRRFEAQLRLAELLLANARSDIGLPIVELLLAAIETHRLGDWQPELCQRTLRLAVQMARAAELDSNRRLALWTRICQSSPSDAIALGPESLVSS